MTLARPCSWQEQSQQNDVLRIQLQKAKEDCEEAKQGAADLQEQLNVLQAARDAATSRDAGAHLSTSAADEIQPKYQVDDLLAQLSAAQQQLEDAQAQVAAEQAKAAAADQEAAALREKAESLLIQLREVEAGHEQSAKHHVKQGETKPVGEYLYS